MQIIFLKIVWYRKKYRSSKWNDLYPSSSSDSQSSRLQSLMSKGLEWPRPNPVRFTLWNQPGIQGVNFFLNLNFDTLYLCSPLAFKNKQYLIWKIYIFTSGKYLKNWGSALLKWFMWAQSYPFLHHKQVKWRFIVKIAVRFFAENDLITFM